MRTIDLSALKSHPWCAIASGSIFLVPVAILRGLSNPEVAPITDFGDGTSRRAHQDEVWEHIKRVGMRDPMVIKIGIPHAGAGATIRLESGNHRIQALEADGITHMPVVGIASDRAIWNEGNGRHLVRLDNKTLEFFYKTSGRTPEAREIYPHPVDLRIILRNFDGEVFSLAEIVPAIAADGLLEFSEPGYARKL